MIRYLVFAGGGVKGTAYAGALTVLDRIGALRHVHGYAGTSSGALAAALMAVGYSPTELAEIYMQYDIKKEIGDIGWLNILRPEAGAGLNTGKGMVEWVRKQVGRATGNPDMTLLDLWRERGVMLITVATNINTQSAEYFSYQTAPNMSIAMAVRISAGVPLMIDAEFWEGSYYVDGGLVDNFPMGLWPDDQTVGLACVSAYGQHQYRPRKEIDGKLDMLLRMVWTPIENQPSQAWLGMGNVIQINTGDVQPLDFDISAEKKRWLLEQGVRGATRYLEMCKARIPKQ